MSLANRSMSARVSNRHAKYVSLRNQKGQALSFPAVMLTIMVIGLIGIFAFEVARMASARDQLRSATEAAALAGAASLASSQESDPAAWQASAISAAKSVFAQNEIFAVSLSSAEEGSGRPVAGQTLLEFKFIDPATKAVVPFGSPNGKVMQLKARHGYLPVFAQFASTVIDLEAEASGGLGELDVVLCFDCSGSMEISTNVSFVRRTWDAVEGKVKYVLSSSSTGSPAAIRPQYLGLNSALRGSSGDLGTPPGNFPPGVAADTGFTDAVVNLDENVNFAGFSEGGFDFPDLGTLVEAARGNLENNDVFVASKANTGLSSVSPKPGYQAKYFELARKHTHPFAEAEAAAKNFFNLMNRNTRAHFGFVSFQSIVGENASTSFTAPNISASYAPGGIGNFPLPGIELRTEPEASNFNECVSAVGTVVPDGGTNIGGSVERAIRMFESGSRPQARKAIILFTDGVPSVGNPLSSNPELNCQMAAQQAKAKGIAVYTVGLALEPAFVSTQQRVLGDNVSTGMAFIAGNESKFFQVTDPARLNDAFTAIARQLTRLVQ